MRETVNLWLIAQSNLKKAATDFLEACSGLTARLASPQSLGSARNQHILGSFLDEVYPHINSIELVLREAHTALNVLRNRSSTHVPVNRLPPELLSHIFALSVDAPTRTEEHSSTDTTLENIRQVCVLWHRVCTNVPRFWSHIGVDLEVFSIAPNIPPMFNRTKRWLNLSHGAPIHLYLSGTSKVSQNTVSGLVSILQPRLIDLESLNIYGRYTSDLVRALFDLHSRLDTPGTLKSLTLSHIQVFREDHAITWPIPSLSGLVELNLRNLRNFASPKLSEIVSLLSNCPLLHTLRLEWLAIRADTQQAYPMIRLPRLRLLELNAFQDQGIAMQLLPLLSPGIHELDVRVHLPFIGPASNSGPHLQALLARSNVTYLILQSDIPLHIVTSLLSSVPHLRALALQHIRPRSQQTLEGLHLGMESDPDPPLPYLQCLCLILSNINSEVIGQLERVLAGRRLRCLVFWSCTFFNPEVNDNDEGDYTTWARDPAQSVRERLLEQVERLVIRPLPLARSHHRGVDLSMQALIAHE